MSLFACGSIHPCHERFSKRSMCVWLLYCMNGFCRLEANHAHCSSPVEANHSQYSLPIEAINLIVQSKCLPIEAINLIVDSKCLLFEANNLIVESYNSSLSVKAKQTLATTNVADAKCKLNSPVETTKMVKSNCLSTIQGKEKLFNVVFVVPTANCCCKTDDEHSQLQI